MNNNDIQLQKINIQVKVPRDLPAETQQLMPCLITAATDAIQTFIAHFLACISQQPNSDYNPGNRRRC